MPSTPSGSWLRSSLAMGLLLPGKEWVTCNLYWMPDASIDLSTFDVKAAAGDFYTALTTGIGPLLGDDAQVYGCHVVATDGTTSLGATKYQNTVGTGAGHSLPEAECLVVANQSLAPGRHSVAHLRVSGICEALVDGNYLTAPGLTAAATWVGNVNSIVSAGGVNFNPAVFHKSTRTLFASVNMFPVGLLGSQRRRKPRL